MPRASIFLYCARENRSSLAQWASDISLSELNKINDNFQSETI